MLSRFSKKIFSGPIGLGVVPSTGLIRMVSKYQVERPDIHRGEISMLMPNTLWDNKGAKKQNVKELGRGRSSTKGKTSGRGHKGQGQRGQKKHPSFEGGQNPLQKRFAKIRIPTMRVIYDKVRLEKFEYCFKRNWLNPEEPIQIKDIYNCGIGPFPKHGFQIYTTEGYKPERPIHLEVSDATPEAIQQIKEAGGSVKIIYFNRITLQQHFYPEKYKFPLQEPYPHYAEVKRLLELEKLGCEVVFRRADWVGEQTEGEELLNKALEEFEYPVWTYPGIGKDRIRKRKPMIERDVVFNIFKKKGKKNQ